MKCKELIKLLEKCNPNKNIIVFDEESIPHEIENVIVDTGGEQELSHIVLKPVESGMM